MIIAHLETSHFTFDAAGETKDEARAAMESGLLQHLKGCHVYDPAANTRELMADLQFFTIHAGMFLRDHEQLGAKYDN